jgi:YegS/Rv2252/BmrU family lipid kinase
MGGDGTLFHAVNGLLTFHGHGDLPPLCVFPTGRGNSFAKDLGINSPADGIAALLSGRTRPVDVCTFTQGRQTFFFVNLMGMGFVSDVARTAARFPLLGDMSYVAGVFHRAVRLRFHRLEMEVDGRSFSEVNCFVEFCNSRYTGGDMLMAPDAKIDDGRFDVVVTGPLSRLELLRTFPRIYRGTHASHPAVRIFTGKRAVLHATPPQVLLPDGELFGSTPSRIGILPHRLRFYA